MSFYFASTSANVQQGQLVVIRLADHPARREREVVVVDQHDVRGINNRQAFRAQMRQHKIGLLAKLGKPLGVGDAGQVNVGDLAHKTVGIGG